MYISAYQRITKVFAFLSILALIGTSIPVSVTTAFAEEFATTISEETPSEELGGAATQDSTESDEGTEEEVNADMSADAGLETPEAEASSTTPVSESEVEKVEPTSPDSEESTQAVEERENAPAGFVINTDGVATIETVALGVTYTAPQNNQVQVTFTSLPEAPGSLSIQEVLLTDEQVAQLGALSNVAYDITSDMENGTFAYDLVLPLPEGAKDDAQVVFAETAADLIEGDIETIATEKLDVATEEQTVAISELDHFTIFVVASFEEVQVTPPDTGYNGEWIAWGASDPMVTQVPSGTDGITSSEGDYHAVIESGAYTVWDGYKTVFPTGGYDTRVDVYVDTSLATGLLYDKRIDYSSAISNTSGSHRRDFIFHLGTHPLQAGKWFVSASNNAPGWPGNPFRSPITLTETGWYTLEHQFRDVGGVLEVTLNIYKKGEVSPIGSWVLSNPSDIIGTTVGGNRYGWFIDTGFFFRFNEFAIDNAEIEYEALPQNEQIVEVNWSELNGWSAATTGGGDIDFIHSTSSQIGDQALNLTTQSDVNDRASLARVEDVDLADVTTLKYSTKRGAGFQAEGNAAYRVRIDADGDTGTTNDVATLVYEPYWQDGDGDFGPITNDLWQTWNVFEGTFWASIPSGNTVAGLTNGAGGPPFYSIDDVLTLHPDAKVIGISVGVGSYNLNYNILVDAVVFGYESDTAFEVTTYDFTVDTVPPETPENLRYDNPAISCGGFTNINYTYPKWDAVSDAVSYDYQALFNGSVVFNANYTTNAHPGGSFGGGQNGLWGFQVRSVDASGLKSEWSPVCEITLDTVVPATPVHVSPADNSTLYVNDFYFDWTDVADIYEYEFQSSQDPAVDGNGALINGVWNNKAHGAPDRDFLTSSTIHSYGANGTWYWQVRAIDEAGNMSPWTTPWKLTIDLDGPDPVPVSEILYPVADGDVVSGTIALEAFYADEDDNNDGVQWAVRSGTCAAGTGTVLGNVDGHSDVFTWDYENFLASFDTTLVANGSYCFVFNPTEDAGDPNQRLTRTFTVENEIPDTTAPAVPTGLAWTDSSSNNVPDHGTTALYAGTASWNANSEDDFSHYIYKYWNEIDASPYDDEATSWTHTLSGVGNTSLGGVFNQGEGVHHFCIVAVDTAGNASACSEPFTITYDISDDDGGDEGDELTPITMCKFVADVPQAGWGMTLSNITLGEGFVSYSTTTDETGCVTISVDLEDGPWTVVEEDRSGYTQDLVTASHGDVFPVGESDTEMCFFFEDSESESQELSLVALYDEESAYNCNFFNSQNEVVSDEEPESPSFSSGTRVGSRTSRPQGQVLGASTSIEEGDFCIEPYLTENLGINRQNDSAQVVRLQEFLNEHMSAGLAVTGVFETSTEQAVMAFQLQYAVDVLTPWGITNATGFVYHTTKKKINELVCARAFPLTSEQMEEISRVKNQLSGGIGTFSVPTQPEETVAGAATTLSGQASATSDEVGTSTDTTEEQKQDEEQGFFGGLWNSLFGN